jgi:hypothetical protein
MTTDKDGELPNIVKQETIVREATKQRHRREIEIFTGVINTFTSGFNSIGSFELGKDNESEYIWLLLTTRCFHSLRCSIDLMLKGYYSQAISLLRTGTEDWFICTNAQSNDKVRDYLLRGRGKMPSYSTLAKTIGTSKVYGDYKFQSKFTHSSQLSLRVLQDRNTNEMRIAPTYDEMLFLACSELFMRVGLLMAEYMGRFLYYIDRDKAKSWDAQNSQRINDTSNWLKELRDKYGSEADTTNHD